MQYIVGNWKMYTTVQEAVALAGHTEDGVADLVRGGHDVPQVIICPPYVSLSPVGDVLDEKPLGLAAQDVHWEPHGSFTGETGTDQLKGLVRYVMLGHPERRMAGETDQVVAKKLAATVAAGFTPILCVGEADANDIADERTLEQLLAALQETELSTIGKLLIAYEPQWAISSGQPAEQRQILEVIQALKAELETQGISDHALLYGGSITRENVDNFLGIPELDGLAVGKGSLDPGEFTGIIESVCKFRPA